MRKKRRLNLRLTENEMKYLESLARARNVNLSEVTRWILHRARAS